VPDSATIIAWLTSAITVVALLVFLEKRVIAAIRTGRALACECGFLKKGD
jgi:hypothetical protein